MADLGRRGWQFRTAWWGGFTVERLFGVGSGPFEVDAEIGHPAIQGPLVGGNRDDPSVDDEFVSGVLDARRSTPKRSAIQEALTRPRGRQRPPLRKSPRRRCPRMVAMSAGRTSREEAQDASGNGDFAVGAGDAVEEGLEFGRVVDGQVVGFVREVEGGLGPNQELGVLKSAEGVLEPSRRESGDLAEFRALKDAWERRRESAPPGVHFVGGEPDAEVDDPNQFPAISPPRGGQERGGNESIAPLGLGGGRVSSRRCGRRAHAVIHAVVADPKRGVRGNP